MSETKTADRAGTIPGAEARTAQPPATTTSAGALAIRPDGWTDDQRAQLRAMGLEHATEPDLKLFHHYCTRTGLDPFTRQVYMVSRRTKIKVREVNPETGNARTVEQDVDKFTIQVGIDGWRVLGNRAAKREGVRVGHEDVLYRGKTTNGVTEWRDYWDGSDGDPLACKYTLTVDGVSISATCMYAEYVQLVLADGAWRPNSMWKKMPANQLAKCAEALAWRKAFPADFAGLVLEDAAQAEVIDGEVVEPGAPATPQQAPPKRARGGARVRERAQAATQEHPRAAREEAKAGEQTPREKLITQLDDLLKAGQVDKFADMAIIVAELGGLDKPPARAEDVATDTIAEVVDKLAALAESGDSRPFGEQLDDVFNRWLTRHPDSEPS